MNLAREQAEEAKEKARQEVEEAKKAAEAEKLAKEQAEEAKERARQEAEEAKKQAEIEAKEKATQEIEEAKQALEAEIAAWEKTAGEAVEAADEISSELYRKDVEPLLSLPITPDQIKDIEKYLKEVESTNEALKKGKIGTEEAIKRLRNISAKIS